MKPLRFTKEELRNLKYKLINESGLTPDEATIRIENMISYTNKISQIATRKEKAEKEKPKQILPGSLTQKAKVFK